MQDWEIEIHCPICPGEPLVRYVRHGLCRAGWEYAEFACEHVIQRDPETGKVIVADFKELTLIDNAKEEV